MKLSKVIGKLQAILDEHGDRHLMIWDQFTHIKGIYPPVIAPNKKKAPKSRVACIEFRKP